MLSLRKFTTPTPNMNNSSRSISTRCRRAKAMTAFMPTLACSVVGGSAVDEQRAPVHYFLARRHAGEDLDHAVRDPPGADRTRGDRSVILRHPDASCVALVDDRALRHGRSARGLAGDDAE